MMDGGVGVLDELDKLVLTEYPYPIAVNYKRLLDEQDWEKKTHICIQVFEFGLRAITLGLISQYLIRDAEKVSDPQLNQLLLKRLSRATLGTWNEMFFKALQAYQGKRNLFFMPELYDLYWDTSTSPHRPHEGICAPFDQLIQIRNDLAHGVPPADEVGWQALFEESFRLLRQVLSHFTFLENYDLIRIRWAEGQEYWYDIYTGLQVISPSPPLRTKEDLTEGWFYLSKQEKKFLELHPLLIFWERELVQAERERMRDAAIFDRFRRTSLDYLATVLREKINLTDRTLIAQFIQMVYYNIEKVKMARREARKLTWWLLKEVTEKVSSERIGDVRSKYRREVYLQREETKRTFEEFLASDKTCLVLIGKSGVGKSNFFLSLMDEYEGSSEVCTLMYNGARFSAETGVAEALTRDFELYLKLEGLVEDEGVGDILFEINRIEGIADRKVVVLIDALNENPDAKGLLRRVDGLVEASPYPWLKVVISSRPETWRTIKRGVRLAEHKYYREEETGELGVEMQPFSIEVEIEPFAREELPAAYAKYQKVFELRTDYEEIPAEVRRMLRDPLTLWLVAEGHRGQEIPQDIKASELYQEYVEALVRTGRLHREDIRFLEQEIVPLMIQEGEYANSITGETISGVKTTDGKSLFELIHSDEVLSSGRRVNKSYANLVDVEILMELGTDVDYEITFKYERFYEYYGGKRLYELNKAKADLVEAYNRLVGEISRHPFLWGVVESALLHELKAGKGDLIINLCYTEGQALKEMMVAVLSEYGQEQVEETCGILEKLIEGRRRAALGSVLLRRGKRLGLREKNVKKVAVEVAEAVGDCDVLHRAARDANPSIRAHAARYIFHLWKHDARRGLVSEETNRGLGILGSLVPYLRNQLGLPNLKVWESGIGIGFMIFMDVCQEYSESRALDGFQKISRRGLSKLLYVSEDRKVGFVQARLRDWVLSLGIQFVLNWLVQIPKYSAGNAHELAAFFDFPQEEKNYLLKFLPYDPSIPLESLREDLLQAAKLDNMVTTFAISQMLVVHGQSKLREVCDITKWLFDARVEESPSSYFAHKMVSVLSVLVRQGVGDEQAFELYCQLLDRKLRTTKGRVSTKSSVYIVPSLHEYLFSIHAMGESSLDWMHEILDQAKVDNDTEFLLATIWELGGLGMADEYSRLVLQAVLPLVEVEDADVRQALLNLLARMRQRHPDEVDDFIADHFTEAVIRRQVRTMEVEEKIWDLLFVPTEAFLHDYALRSSAEEAAGPSMLSQQITWALKKAVECQNLAQWVTLVGKRIANLAYGAEVFGL